MNYSVEKLSSLIDAKLIGNNKANISFVLTDSRSLCFPEETVFFALKSERNDGHHFIPELYRRGVRNFVVQELPDKLSEFPQTNFLMVADSLTALQQLAECHRKEFHIPVIGITGSR